MKHLGQRGAFFMAIIDHSSHWRFKIYSKNPTNWNNVPYLKKVWTNKTLSLTTNKTTCFLKWTTHPPKPQTTKTPKKNFSNMTVTPCICQTLHHATPKYASQPNIAQTLHWLDISGDWWPQAELVDRSLLAYTPAPSNPSFMGAFVQWNWNGCLFSGEASSLDAFSSYPQQRGCPATALSDNRLTRGYSVPFLSY